MRYFARPISALIDELAKLPGIGPKTAQRLAFYILSGSREQAQNLARTVLEAKEKIGLCSRCCNLTEDDPCSVCQASEREKSLLCIVEQPRDVLAVERTGEYKGLYHVLHGSISPIDGIGPDDIKIKELLKRLEKEKFAEIIIATDPNVEGEATALYLARLLKPLELKVSRIAHGVPVGGDLEFADEVTLSKALEGRKSI